ncbi:unnamed protein product [Mycetohabitans rhizoxinica HKI 454]|uniref:Uncharacterized protein n=1 Tax=Mycetohabitans rhizoxinica (strain DSM 19002 / CIP 109453 / HKI 454) TaxID=882378 RepID=E5AR84_MYCRK|nr:unnamed protein product [Mycetohabitans rhizoxinica HKI 454]
MSIEISFSVFECMLSEFPKSDVAVHHDGGPR